MLMAQQDFIGPYSRDGETFALIKAMLEIFPSKRPTVRNVLDSIFFNERITEENVLGTNFFLLVSVTILFMIFKLHLPHILKQFGKIH